MEIAAIEALVSVAEAPHQATPATIATALVTGPETAPTSVVEKTVEIVRDLKVAASSVATVVTSKETAEVADVAAPTALAEEVTLTTLVVAVIAVQLVATTGAPPADHTLLLSVDTAVEIVVMSATVEAL